jgi:hypothetical protein
VIVLLEELFMGQNVLQTVSVIVQPALFWQPLVMQQNPCDEEDEEEVEEEEKEEDEREEEEDKEEDEEEREDEEEELELEPCELLLEEEPPLD